MFKFSTRSLECKSKMFGGDTKTYDHNIGVDHQQGTTNLLGSIRRGMYLQTSAEQKLMPDERRSEIKRGGRR